MANGFVNSLFPFDPFGAGYDYETARRKGITPNIPMAQPHWSSLAPLSPEEAQQAGLPFGSGLVLKGTGHESYPLTAADEKKLGNEIIFKNGRYYSVPTGGITVANGLSLYQDPQVGQLSAPPQMPLGQMPGAVNPFPQAQPGAGIPGAVPTTDPQEIETRKSGWRQFVDRLRTDPALQQALLSFGAQALQPIPPGGTAAGQFGQAAAAGGQAYSQQKALAGRQQYLESTAQSQRIGAEASAKQAETGARRQTALERYEQGQLGVSQQRADTERLVGEASAELARARARAGGFAPHPQAAATQLRDQIARDLISTGQAKDISEARLMADKRIKEVPDEKLLAAMLGPVIQLSGLGGGVDIARATQDAVAAIRVLKGEQPGADAGVQAPQGLPPGSTQVGVSKKSGNPVYKAPDGKLYEVTP